jgi:glycerol kinase
MIDFNKLDNQLTDMPKGKIVFMIGDQQSATLGLQVASQDIKITYGTGCFLMQNTGPQVQFKQGLLSTVILQLGEEESPLYGLEAAVESGASTLNFFKDELRIIGEYEENDRKLMNKIRDKLEFFFENESILNSLESNEESANFNIYENETLLVPCLNSTLFSPFWESNIQGQISNLNFSTGQTEIYAATLESLCSRIKQCTDVMDIHSSTNITIDGGVSQNNYLAHYQANLLQNDLKRLKGLDGTMRGVFLGCLAFVSRKKFNSVIKMDLHGTLIKTTKNKNIQNLLQRKYKRFDEQIRHLINSK